VAVSTAWHPRAANIVWLQSLLVLPGCLRCSSVELVVACHGEPQASFSSLMISSSGYNLYSFSSLALCFCRSRSTHCGLPWRPTGGVASSQYLLVLVFVAVVVGLYHTLSLAIASRRRSGLLKQTLSSSTPRVLFTSSDSSCLVSFSQSSDSSCRFQVEPQTVWPPRAA
jgi:hypothetical protein